MVDRLSANHRRDLMEIVEDRYGAGSTLITSQLPARAAQQSNRPLAHPRRRSRTSGQSDADTNQVVRAPR